MLPVNNDESTDRQPNPWLTLFLFIATVIVAFFLPGLWLARSPLLQEAVGAFTTVTVFAIYTFIYGGVHQVSQRQGLLEGFMVAGPWLFAAVNVWGKVVPTVLTTTDALTGLLVAVLIGVSEEMLFRGVLFRAFRGRSAALYVLVTSITFGLLHYDQGYQGVMTTAVVGMSFSLARVAGSSLSLLIVCHAAIDFPSLFPHTPHPQYPLVAYGALVMALVIALAFFSRRINWTTRVGNPLPSL